MKILIVVSFALLLAGCATPKSSSDMAGSGPTGDAAVRPAQAVPYEYGAGKQP